MPVPSAVLAGLHAGFDVAALCADARNEQRHGLRPACARPPVRPGRSRRPPVPADRCVFQSVAARRAHLLIQRRCRRRRASAGRRRPGLLVRQSRNAPRSGIGEKRLERIAAHVGRQRDRIGLIALEGLARVVLGSRADVAALGIQDHRDLRMRATDVLDQALELRLGARRREVRDLRLEGADQVGGGVHDLAAEAEDRIVTGVQVLRESATGPGPVPRTAVCRPRASAKPGDRRSSSRIHGMHRRRILRGVSLRRSCL